MDLAPAIHSTVSDSTIIADDATEGRPFRGPEGVWKVHAGEDGRKELV